MSVRVESAPVRGSFPASIVIAIIVALGVGAVAGTLITKAVDDRPAAVASPVGAQLWDAQKLQAMQGRAMAEQFRNAVVLSAAELNALRQGVVPERLQGQQDSAVVLTAAELIGLRNGELAARLQGGPVLWDAHKLEAMEGRVLAAQVGAEDPPVKPHLPKRPPRG